MYNAENACELDREPGSKNLLALILFSCTHTPLPNLVFSCGVISSEENSFFSSPFKTCMHLKPALKTNGMYARYRICFMIEPSKGIRSNKITQTYLVYESMSPNLPHILLQLDSPCTLEQSLAIQEELREHHLGDLMAVRKWIECHLGDLFIASDWSTVHGLSKRDNRRSK